jgi:acylphosphatase
MAKNLILKIYGEVQGVGFRDAVYWKARKLYIAGFVMNEPDGSIYIEAEGEKAVLEEFLAWCRKGPITAKVTRTHLESGPAGFANQFRARDEISQGGIL